MYPGGIWWLLIGINLAWLGVLTWVLLKQATFIKKLLPQGGNNFSKKLEELFKEIKDFKNFKKESLGFVQKVACRRYNPYHDTGGDQSFSIALLDGRGDGVVISSLHSRSGTRVFAKPVKGGQEDRFPLAQEEKEVLKEAYAQ